MQGDNKVISLGSGVAPTHGYAAPVTQFKRNGRFTEKLVKHGFELDTTLFAASKRSERQVRHVKHRFEGMNSIIDQFYSEVSNVLSLQHQLVTLQQRMAWMALEMLSARKIQQMIRGWVARHKLWILRVSRFIYDRIYFRRYFKRRRKAACKVCLRVLIFLARKMLKFHRTRACAARMVQKVYHKWKIYRNLCTKLAMLGKVAMQVKHIMLFGKCRAVMHMRRVEVARVQCEEKTLCGRILIEEQRRAAEEAVRAEEEARRAEAEAKKAKPKNRFQAAAIKQAQKAPVASTSEAGKATVPSGLSALSIISSVADFRADSLATSPKNGPGRALDPAIVLKAISAGVIAGKASVQAMHTFTENRYGSVYGGFYGEYCCYQDNWVHSYAAVRFRFMLRCLRRKRLKALSGPEAKNFFYTLSHLHNTPTERHPNEVIVWLQRAVRAFAVQRAVRHTAHAIASGGPGGAGGGGAAGNMGKMLLSSARRNKGMVATDAAVVPVTDSELAAQTMAEADDAPSSTFLTAMSGKSSTTSSTTSSAAPPSPRKSTHTSALSPQAPASPASPNTRAAAFPTFAPEQLPNCFLTHSYRPKTFAELVLMLCDLRRTVLKTPSLVDDSQAPSTKTGKRGTNANTRAVITGVARSMKRMNETATAAPATSVEPVMTAAPDLEPASALVLSPARVMEAAQAPAKAPAASAVAEAMASEAVVTFARISVLSTPTKASTESTVGPVSSAAPFTSTPAPSVTGSTAPESVSTGSDKIAGNRKQKSLAKTAKTEQSKNTPIDSSIVADTAAPAPTSRTHKNIPNTAPTVIIENIVMSTAADKSATKAKSKAAAMNKEPAAPVVGVLQSYRGEVTAMESPGPERPEVQTAVATPTVAAPAPAPIVSAKQPVAAALAEQNEISPAGPQVPMDIAPEPRGNSAEAETGSGKLSVPVQLRKHSRVMRPSKVTLATPEFVPAPYPHHQPSAPSSAGTATGSIAGSVAGSRRSSVNYPTDFSDIPEDMYVMPAMQSVAPSAIIAAARESIRQAEAAGESGVNARGLPPRNRALRQSY